MGIEQICDQIRRLFDMARKPAAAIAGLIMICSLMKRGGLSVIISVGNVIKNSSNYGIPTELAPDGTPNLQNAYTQLILTEVYRALREDANIQVAMGPQSINFAGTGANAGGPVTVLGANINFGKGVAQIQ